MLIEKIVKYTLETDPTLPQLKEQQAILKKNMSELNQLIDSQNTKALKNLQTLQTLIGPSIQIVIQTRHLITKVIISNSIIKSRDNSIVSFQQV